MGSKILLVGRAGEETLNLRRELKRQENYSVDVATTPTQAIETLVKDPIDLLVFTTEVLTKKKLQMTADLKELGKDLPLLLLANSIMADSIGDLSAMNGTVFLEKPFEPKDFFGITEKLIAGTYVKQRHYRRFVTNQDAGFSKPPAMDVFTSMKIRNLSQGGAYFEYEGRPLTHIGDYIVLEIPLKEIQRQYRMRARVVWTTPPTVGRNGLGVEFLR